MHIIGAIVIGFLAGLVARWLTPGRHELRGFILTTVLGIVGALFATFLGQQIGWYHEGENAGFIGAVIGAILILLIWRATIRAGEPRS
jgi:uncharacterized membrane protein YeaQ/YmgE (transglycosylase-associated protein family)